MAACSVCAYPKYTPVPFREDDDLGRLPGGVERALRAREEDADRALRRLPAPVRLRLVRAGDRQPLRARRQLRPRGLARDRRDGPQVRATAEDAATREVDALGHRRADRASSSTSTTRRARWSSPPSATTPPTGQHRHRGRDRDPRARRDDLARWPASRARPSGTLPPRRPAEALPRRLAAPASRSASRRRWRSRRACAGPSRVFARVVAWAAPSSNRSSPAYSLPMICGSS